MEQKVIAIVPAYNEELKIGNVVRKIKLLGNLVNEIVVVDDCSSDRTGEVAQKEGATVIRHEKNMGVGAGIRNGINYGKEKGYSIGVILSGDDQHKPEELPFVLQPVINDEVDFVQGSRYLKGGGTINQNLFRKITTRLYPVIFLLFTGKKCTDVTNGLRAFKIEKMLSDKNINLQQDWLNRYELEVYMLYKVYNSRNWRKKEVPITVVYHDKQIGSTKMKAFKDWWRILRPVLFLKFRIKQ